MNLWSPEQPHPRKEFNGYVETKRIPEYQQAYDQKLKRYAEVLSARKGAGVSGEQLGKALINIILSVETIAEKDKKPTFGTKDTGLRLQSYMKQAEYVLGKNQAESLVAGAFSEFAFMTHLVESEQGYPVYMPDENIDNYEEGMKIDGHLNFDTDGDVGDVVGTFQIKAMPFEKPLTRHIYDLSSERDQKLVETLLRNNLSHNYHLKDARIAEQKLTQESLVSYSEKYENVAPLLVLMSSISKDNERGNMRENQDKRQDEYMDINPRTIRLGQNADAKMASELLSYRNIYLTKWKEFGSLRQQK